MKYEDLPPELLEGVLAHPDDDQPRLAVADWLDAQGDPWGEQIRMDVKRLRLRQAGDPTYREHLSLAPRTYLSSRWFGPVVRFDRGHIGSVRGFCEHLTLDAREFLRNAEEIYACAPIRSLELWNVRPVAKKLFSSPHLARLSRLTMARWAGSLERFKPLRDKEIDLLLASPHVENLRWLSLVNNEITDAGVEAIAAATTLPNLEYLNVASNPCRSIEELRSYDPITQEYLPSWTEPSEFAKELEARYGYKPWLHPWKLSPFDDGPSPIDY